MAAPRFPFDSALRLPLSLGIMTALFAPPAAAEMLCSTPVTPTCIEDPASFEAEVETKRCRQDVEDYLEKAQEFIDCLEGAAAEATRHAAEIQRRFECRASGQTDCQ